MTTDRDRVDAALSAWFGEGDWRTRNVRYRELMSQALAAADALAPPADTGDEAATAMRRLEQVLDDERIAAHGLEAEVEHAKRRGEQREQEIWSWVGKFEAAESRAETAEARLARAREALDERTFHSDYQVSVWSQELDGLRKCAAIVCALADTDPAGRAALAAEETQQ